MKLIKLFSRIVTFSALFLFGAVFIACSHSNYDKVTISTAKKSQKLKAPIINSTARLDPIARYGGYVLTSQGMPHGIFPAYLWAKNMGTLVAYETFLRRYPEGKYADYFRDEIREEFVPLEEEWQEAWKLYSQMDTIDGAIFDPKEGFILIGRRTEGNLSPFFYEDLITALKCSIADEKVGVTMNRVFEARFKQPEKSNDYILTLHETSVDFYSEILWNTHLAYTLFEGDRMLKSLSQGYDIFLREELRSEIKGYRSIIEMAAAETMEISPGGKYGRIWIELTDVKINTTEQNNVAILTNFEMKVNAESKHEPPMKFANHIQNNYAAYGKEFPIFAEVERAARVVAISRWLVKVYPSVAKKLVEDAYEQVEVYVPQVIDARFNVTHKTSTYQQGLIGGVVFPKVNKYAVKPESKINDTTLSQVQLTVLEDRPNEKTLAWTVYFDDKKKSKYIAWHVSAPVPNPDMLSMKNMP